MRTCTPLLQAALLTLLLSCPVMGQVAYPPYMVQDVYWTSGTHHVGVSPQLLSPGSPAQPVTISGDAVGEFVSGTSVRLAKGFHAGAFTGNGSFHAWVDEGLEPGHVVLIAPDPSTHVQGQVLHVNKWEELEIGLQLPQDYQDAIDRFFAHYYADPNDPFVATPGNVDPVHDLNPYADDSLQLVMTLTKPDGTQTMKWGFFMREGKWEGTDNASLPIEDPDDPLYPYHIRFRLAPDMEGPWEYTLSLNAPLTNTPSGAGLPPALYTGYAFVCDPPLPDNHGPLRVNEANRRTLKFEDGTPYFGLGTNFALVTGHGSAWSDMDNYRLTRESFTEARDAMEALQSVGGNFVRIFLGNRTFSPEYVHLGVYDRYVESLGCNPGDIPIGTGNYQNNCWAFDQLVNHARTTGTYLQACVKPYPPIIAYEPWGWHNDAYLSNFVEPRDSLTNLYDMKRYFYSNGDPSSAGTPGSAFYYWKRRYKYIMNRWGHSVNIPIIEPFNEVDQMLTYRTRDLSPGGANCPENSILWPADPDLPAIYSQWLTDIISYVKGEQDFSDPVHSPLGENDKLFLVSYASGNVNDQSYFLPFTNPKVDLLDVHKYIWPNPSQAGQPDHAMEEVFDHAQAFRSQYPSTNPSVPRKPFNHGESNYFTDLSFGGHNYNIEKLFHNYDVSFHNELWSSAFSGNFATSLTWHWERVFWWPNALGWAPNDQGNPTPWSSATHQFSNALGDINILDIGGLPVPVINRTTYHHFKPLADLLANPNWQSDDFFNSAYTPHKYHDPVSGVECYYLMNADSTLAIGWVHNLNAWVMNSFYLASSNQNFLGCTVPGAQTIALHGFQPGLDYHISWFPTRMNDTILPAATLDTTGTGTVLLDFSSAPLGGVLNQYLDTLHADYAFIVALQHVPKNMLVPAEEEGLDTPVVGLDFRMFPNPAGNSVTLVFTSEDKELDIALYDLTGKRVLMQSGTTTSVMVLPTGNLARGAYAVRVSDGKSSAMKTLILR